MSKQCDWLLTSPLTSMSVMEPYTQGFNAALTAFEKGDRWVMPIITVSVTGQTHLAQ